MAVMTVYPPHVLVVDDNGADLLRAIRILSAFNVRVTAVYGAEEALNILDQVNDVKLIVTAYQMPGMSGYDLLKAVKESPRLSRIPVVMAYSDVSYEELDMCLEAELHGYVFKPLDVGDGHLLMTYIF